MKLNYWLLWLMLAVPKIIIAQAELVLTIQSGNSTTACRDFLGGEDPFWRVNIEDEGWVIYDEMNSCYTQTPNIQYRQSFACLSDLPADIEVCFSAFENDDIGFEFGLSCDVVFDCEESICERFPLPAAGDSINYTLALPGGGDSGGSITFTLANRYEGAVDNDDICNATDLGIIEDGQQIGDASQGIYSNVCATIENEINPFDVGGWINDAGVWFTFITGDNPGHYLSVEALSDPEMVGDSLGLELAVFSSDNNACDGNLNLLGFQFNQPSLNSKLNLICPQPNTRYYIMVDGGPELGVDRRGVFGIQVAEIGIEEAPDERCDAEDLGTIPIGGSVATNGWRSNFCGTDTRDPFVQAFQSQHSVWFKFRVPPSGHILIEGVSDTSSVPLGIQLALYRVSSNDCNGFFRHLNSIFTFEDLDEFMEAKCLFPNEELYVLIDGSGSHSRGVFSLTIHDAGDITPVFTQDTTICAGQSFQVYQSDYDRSGTYRDTIPVFAGCDSVVVTNLTVLETIEATVNIIQPAIGANTANGVAEVMATGGQGAYTYSWCNGQTNPRNDQLAGGEECCVTVTDELGCADIVCFEVPQVLPLTFSFENDTLDCFGDQNGIVNFQIMDGQAPYSYNWRKIDGSLDGDGVIAAAGDSIFLSDLPAGSYQIDVEDQYFNTSFVIEIVEPQALLINLNSVINPSCNGFCDGQINLEATGGNDGYQWLWSDNRLSGATSANVCAGDYQVTLTDAKGCMVEYDILVEEPPPFIAEATETREVSCFEGSDGELSVTTNGNPVSFVWNSGQTDPVIGGLAAGSYSVVVTNEDGCEATVGAIVTQPDQPVGVSLDITRPISCSDSEDGVMEAIVTGPGQTFSYQWNNGVNTNQNSQLSPGNYGVTVTNERGCIAEANQMLVSPPAIGAQLAAKDITCLDPPDGGRIEVATVNGGRPGYTFSLDGILFKESPVFERLPEGAYTLTVRDMANCEMDFEIAVEGPPVLKVSLGGDQVVQLGEIIQLQPLANSDDLTIEWNQVPEGFTQGDAIFTLQPLETVRYSVQVMDNTTFCTASDEVLIQVKKDRKVFLPNVFSPIGKLEENRRFMIYGGLGIKQVDALRVFDRQGGLVFYAENFQVNDPAFAWDGMRNGQVLPSGVYVYVAEISFIDGETELFSGDVSLMR